MESYAAFLERIRSFETAAFNLPAQDFQPNKNLHAKVDMENQFKPFYGDTVVFDVGNDIKSYCQSLADQLHQEVPDGFAQALVPSTFHMTLHDLSNGTEWTSLETELSENKERIRQVFQTQPIPAVSIHMRTHFIFNMVNTSVVLGLCPESAEDYEYLMSLYEQVDRVKQLPYPLTPHITLVYYAATGFPIETVEKLKRLIEQLNQDSRTVELYTDQLYYQRFSSMNDYMNVLRLCDVQ